MKKMFEVKIPNKVLFENLDDAIWFAKELSNAKTAYSESVYSNAAKDARTHYINYIRDIDMNINFTSKEYLEDKWEAIDRKAKYMADEKEIEKRNNMTEEARKEYMEKVKNEVGDLWDTDYAYF